MINFEYVKKILYSSVFGLLLMIVISGFILSFVYDWQKQSAINKIRGIYQEQVNLNKRLKHDYNYYNSNLYIQKEALDNLGLANKNSALIVLPVKKTQGSKEKSNNIRQNKGIDAWLHLLNM